MLTLELLQHFEFDDDVSFIRADPYQPMLLMNAGHAALRVLDVDQMTERMIDLSDFAAEFLIYDWLVDRAGRCSLLISADKLNFGIGIDHRRLVPFRFDLPTDVPHFANICWTEPSLRLVDVHGAVWTSQADRLMRAAPEIQDEEPQHAYAALAKRYAILSHDWETGHVCILDGEHMQVGVFAPVTAKLSMVNGTGAEIGAPHHRGHLFVCLSDGVDLVIDGERRRILQAAPSNQMFGIEIGPRRGGSYLAVTSGSMSTRSRPASVVDVYAIHV